MKVTMPSFSAALPSLLSGAPACSARPSEASSSRPHSLGVLSNTNFDRHGAMPSAVQFCCAKSRACAVIGMLAHGSAADIIKIDNDNLRKVRARLGEENWATPFKPNKTPRHPDSTSRQPSLDSFLASGMLPPC